MTGTPPSRARFPMRGVVGLIGLAAAELLLFAGNPFVRQFFTPLAWTFYIFLIDATIERIAGHSPMTRAPGQLAWVAAASIGIWYLFEGYNLRMEGWIYVGLPERTIVRLAGYFWAFATIGPGLLLTRELVQLLLPRRARAGPPAAAPPVDPALLWSSGLTGLACVLAPFLVPQEVARYLWAPVWAGFILLVDPINAATGRVSIWRDVRGGDHRRLVSLLVAGLICGGLWELWNFWADTKWIYTFPLGGLERVKLFEMPVVGFAGFPPFAVEYFVLTELVSRLWRGNADLAGFRNGPASF